MKWREQRNIYNLEIKLFQISLKRMGIGTSFERFFETDEFLPPKVPDAKKVKTFTSNGKFYTFLPAYVEIDPKKLFNLSSLKGTVQFRGRLKIKLLDFPQEANDYLQNQLCIFLPDEGLSVKLTQEVAQRTVDGNGCISLTYDIDQQFSWEPNLLLLPFDKQELSFSLMLAPFKIGENQYYFNIQTNNQIWFEYPLPNNPRTQRLEDFSLYYYQTKYDLIEETAGGKIIGYYPQITLDFRLVRNPWNFILTVLIPNTIIQLLTITVFFTDNNFQARLGTIIGLVFTLVALIPSVRSKLPPIPFITFLDIFIYSGVVNLGLCLLDTSLKRHNPDYENNACFIIVCYISFGVFASAFFLTCVRTQEYCSMRKRVKRSQSVILTLLRRRLRRHYLKHPELFLGIMLRTLDNIHNIEVLDQRLTPRERRYMEHKLQIKRQQQIEFLD